VYKNKCIKLEKKLYKNNLCDKNKNGKEYINIEVEKDNDEVCIIEKKNNINEENSIDKENNINNKEIINITDGEFNYNDDSNVNDVSVKKKILKKRNIEVNID